MILAHISIRILRYQLPQKGEEDYHLQLITPNKTKLKWLAGQHGKEYATSNRSMSVLRVPLKVRI